MRILRCFVTIAAIAALCACALPAHNNTLIFSVKRKIGIGANASAEGMPNVYIGYSSNELAWVPLWANGKDGPMPCSTAPLASSTATTSSSGTTTTASFDDAACKKGPKLLADDGGKPGHNKHDAFSTFSSFGGDLGAVATGNSQSAEVRGRLASFFATGVAAQNLSEHVGLVGDVFLPGQEKKKKTGADPAIAHTASAREFLALTEDSGANASKVRAACVKLLAAKALLSEKETQEMGALPITTSKDWEAALLKNRDLSESLPVIGRAGAFLEKDFKAKLEDKGRKDLALGYCL